MARYGAPSTNYKLIGKSFIFSPMMQKNYQ